jgi:hypothetical protein
MGSKIGSINALRSSNITSDPSISGFPTSDALDGRTSTRGGYSAGTRTISFSFSSQLCGYCGIGKNNIPAGSTISVYTNGALRATKTVLRTAPHMFVFSESLATSCSFVINSSSQFFVSDFACGKILDIPRYMTVGFSPPRFSDEDEIITNTTVSGELNGITVIQKPKKTVISIKKVHHSFFDENWTQFLETSKKYPFYFLYAPEDRPDECFYCWHAGKVGDVKYSTTVLQDVDLLVEGFC